MRSRILPVDPGPLVWQLLGELIGHVIEDASSHMAAEARRVSERGQQAAKQHTALVEVVRMLFPQGSAVAAGLVVDLVKPEMIAGETGKESNRQTTRRCVQRRTSAHAIECLASHIFSHLLTSFELALVMTAGIDFNELIFEKCLGEGAFSRVYAATLRDRAVAVKQLRLDLAEADVVRFIDEVAVMHELTHPNVVQFVGSVWEPR